MLKKYFDQFLEEKYSQEDRETNQKKFQQHLENLKVSTGQVKYGMEMTT